MRTLLGPEGWGIIGREGSDTVPHRFDVWIAPCTGLRTFVQSTSETDNWLSR